MDRCPQGLCPATWAGTLTRPRVVECAAGPCPGRCAGVLRRAMGGAAAAPSPGLRCEVATGAPAGTCGRAHASGCRAARRCPPSVMPDSHSSERARARLCRQVPRRLFVQRPTACRVTRAHARGCQMNGFKSRKRTQELLTSAGIGLSSEVTRSRPLACPGNAAG